MKILLVVSYGYLAGGAEKSVLLLKENLQAKGHKVKILASNHDSGLKHFSDIEFPEIDSSKRSMTGKLLNHLWYPASYRCLKDTIEQIQPDVIHFHTMGQLSPSAFFAIGDTPAVLTVHGPEEYVSKILEWSLPAKLFKNGIVDRRNFTALGRGYDIYYRYVQKPFYRAGIKRLRALVAPSQYMAHTLEKENFGVDVRQIYNGIELPKTKKIVNKQRLLYVGRLEHVKGVDVLLRALPRIICYFSEVHLDIVGDGASRKELELFVEKNDLRKYVTFCGWLQGSEVQQKMIDATLIVIPSIWPENLPTVCIEALGVGRPVVGSQTGGIPELIQENRTGKVVKVGSSSDLSLAIVELLRRKDLAVMSQDCFASAQKFSIETFIGNIEKLYEEVI